MNEGPKTAIFVGAALVLSLASYWSIPKPADVDLGVEIGSDLFEFEDPAKAASLEIIRYDEDLGKPHDFKVAKNSKTELWTIPSHSDYPADAAEQVRDAVTTLIGLKKLGLATEEKSEHELFGVVEPVKEGAQVPSKGVGLSIRVEDTKGKDLAKVIIGKPVKGTEDQRFVRIPGQDVVYAASIDPEKLSTIFGDWIKSDLLSLSAIDVEMMQLRDYSVVQSLQGGVLEKRSEVRVNWNSTDSKWELEKMLTFRGREEVPTELLDNEELDTTKLNDVKNAFSDLKIVDVRRKPAGLGANLKADKSFMDDPESRRSLMQHGYYASATESGDFELFAANGEVYVGMKDGYEYILRFGSVAITDESGDDGSLNRYLFVSARVDDSKFPTPELEPEPTSVEPATPAADDAPAPPDADAEKEDADDAKNDDKKSDDAKSDDAKNDDAKSDDEKKKEAEEEQKRQLQAAIERVEKENKRKMDTWEEDKKKAADKVSELNSRFSDWYYIISEDVYKRVHLSRNDIIKENAAAVDEGFGIDAFRKLQEDGVNPPPDAPTGPPAGGAFPGGPPFGR
ncbi:MAG TPA: DUF4340 domain-containing protein [Pirellulaceae bacterium]|nr:DUF4340 domain-containing protein [Pirellulaceae bacterium]